MGRLEPLVAIRFTEMHPTCGFFIETGASRTVMLSKMGPKARL